MRKSWIVLALFVLAFPLSAAGQDCSSQVDTTRQALESTQARASSVPEAKRPRIQSFLNDAAKLLAQAQENCARAQSPLDRSYAIAKLLVAQGNISAAHLLIKAD